uniref:Uncharacterized protein n=1 Tax=Tetraselmis sp. GSL018 TaxID=582737 RepID=A0A061RMX3_9CHLO|mmetsp:Transcript_7582/g.18204  ORF Transcript_7582/g.18204 Transcript_7582/m.18204 type:complete len:231 (+) Transcript_7582:110-802(+)
MAAFRGSVQLSGRNMSSGCFRSLECSFPRKPCTSLTTTTTRLGKPNCLGFQSSEHSFSWSFAKRRRCLSVRVSRNRGPQSERKPKRDEGKPWDPVLVAGDLLMLIATDLASERIPLRDQGFLGFVVCTVWLLAATARGDYNRSGLDGEPLSAWSLFGPMMASMQSALYTWVLFAPAAGALVCYMVSHGLFDPAVLEAAEGGRGPAISEVFVGSFLTMASWRGIYVGLYML